MFYDVAVKHRLEKVLAGHSHRNLDISYRGIRGSTVMNARGPYRLVTVIDQGLQIVNRCTGCKDPSYHSKSCALARGHKTGGAAGTGGTAKLANVAMAGGAKSLGQAGPAPAELLAVIDPGKSKRCGLLLKPQGGGAPLEIALADNVLTVGGCSTARVRRPDQPLYDVRVYVEKGIASVYACGRIQFDVSFELKGPFEVEPFAEGGPATLKTFDLWAK